MIHHNTTILMNHITLGISVESRDVQYIYDIRILIGNGNRIIFKSLIASIDLGSCKNKQLGFSRNCCICYHITSLPELLFHIPL